MIFRMIGVVIFNCLVIASTMAQSKTEHQEKLNEFNMVMNIVQIPRVGQEVGVNAEQNQQIMEFRKKFSRDLNTNLWSNIDSSEKEEHAQERLKKLEKELKEILLPTQVERLKQIARQYKHLRDQSTFGILAPATVKALNISDSQKQEMEKKAKELEVEMQKEMDKIREKIVTLKEKHRTELLKLLDQKQREQFAKLYGPIFSIRY